MNDMTMRPQPWWRFPIVWLVVGGLIGWIASMIMRTDAQQGVVLNVIVGLVGATDLRAANVIAGEVGGLPSVAATSFKPGVGRDDPSYIGLLNELGTHPAIGKKGHADQLVVADTVFGEVEDGAVPTLMSADDRVFGRLAERYLPPNSFEQKVIDGNMESIAAAVARTFSEFEIKIPDGLGGLHRLRVVPVHSGGKS